MVPPVCFPIPFRHIFQLSPMFSRMFSRFPISLFPFFSPSLFFLFVYFYFFAFLVGRGVFLGVLWCSIETCGGGRCGFCGRSWGGGKKARGVFFFFFFFFSGPFWVGT